MRELRDTGRARAVELLVPVVNEVVLLPGEDIKEEDMEEDEETETERIEREEKERLAR